MLNIKKFLISRTDNIGDLVLTLPLAGFLKQNFPDIQIAYLVKDYTKPIADSYKYIDEVYSIDKINEETKEKERIKLINSIDADVIIFVYPDREVMSLVAKSNISRRIATSHRTYSWRYASNLVNFSRKNSYLHEAQLNFLLLKPLQIDYLPSINELLQWYGKDKFYIKPIPKDLINDFAISPYRPIIIHPGSMGSAPNLSPQHFLDLTNKLVELGENIYITGNEKEGLLWQPYFDKLNVKTLFGSLNLYELISIISKAKAVIASSTGPLHIAAALDTNAIGLYVPIGTYAPHRWSPIGKNAKVLTPAYHKISCKSKCISPSNCTCINEIKIEKIINEIYDIETE